MDDLEEFDRPLFKKLAHNDTGAAAGHQGGIVIPKDLDSYFPQLKGEASEAEPTIEGYIRAALFVGYSPVGVVDTRYQFQTWGGTRSPERRLTNNLSALRDLANADDYLTIERNIQNPGFYRLRLLKAGSPGYDAFHAKVGDRRWGPVDPGDPPVQETAVLEALDEQKSQELGPLSLFDNSAALAESRIKRIARSRAFQMRVPQLYGYKCALCGNGFRSPGGLSEIEAAHIVPRSLKGADDVRNGLALCRSHHWAFDRGLFGVHSNFLVEIPAAVSALNESAQLLTFASVGLTLPAEAGYRPSPHALSWHMDNVLGRF